MELFKLATVRELTKADLPFVANSFIESLSKYKESFFKGWQHPDIIQYLEYLIYWALNNENYSILIACDANDSDHIILYLIANPRTNEIFFQYTKYSLRGSGVQKFMLMPLLLKETEPVITNWATKSMLKLAKQGKVIIKQQFVLNVLKEKETTKMIIKRVMTIAAVQALDYKNVFADDKFDFGFVKDLGLMKFLNKQTGKLVYVPIAQIQEIVAEEATVEVKKSK